MVKHVILWTLKEEYSDQEKEEIKAGIKEGLEGLMGQIPGLLEIHVQTESLPSSNVDHFILASSRFSEDAFLSWDINSWNVIKYTQYLCFAASIPIDTARLEIGRASCRERV